MKRHVVAPQHKLWSVSATFARGYRILLVVDATLASLNLSRAKGPERVTISSSELHDESIWEWKVRSSFVMPALHQSKVRSRSLRIPSKAWLTHQNVGYWTTPDWLLRKIDELLRHETCRGEIIHDGLHEPHVGARGRAERCFLASSILYSGSIPCGQKKSIPPSSGTT